MTSAALLRRPAPCDPNPMNRLTRSALGTATPFSNSAATRSWPGCSSTLCSVLILPVGEQAEERAGCVTKVVDGGKAFVNGGLRWLADYSALRVGVHAEGGQVAAVGCVVIAGVPAVADVAGARGEQHRRLEFAGMHVVVVSHKSIP